MGTHNRGAIRFGLTTRGRTLRTRNRGLISLGFTTRGLTKGDIQGACNWGFKTGGGGLVTLRVTSEVLITW